MRAKTSHGHFSQLQKISFEACLDLNRSRGDLDEERAHYWAEVSKNRFSLTAQKILEYSKGRSHTRILNASGMGSGDHDVSIIKCLKEENISFDWEVYDSPNNPYLEKSYLKTAIEESGVGLSFFDYTDIKKNDDKKYDIILFSEIAEHLDHSVFLRALNFLNEKLEDDGVVIITTPNMLWLPARIKYLLGREGNIYYGHGNQNLEANVYGHITYFTPQRLQRLVEDCGFKTRELFTFDWLPMTEKFSFWGDIWTDIVNFSAALVGKLGKGTIFLSVGKCDANKRKIPFET